MVETAIYRSLDRIETVAIFSIDLPGGLNGEICPIPNGKEVSLMLYLPREEGQGLVEYALILVLVAIVVIAILALLGPQIGNIFSKVTNGLGGT